MYEGGCLCGEIRFEIHGEIRDVVCCHCSECRKAQGNAFATNSVVRVRLGTIDSDIRERPMAHTFLGSRANWEEACGSIPQFEECVS